jgi:hypothetical protein
MMDLQLFMALDLKYIVIGPPCTKTPEPAIQCLVNVTLVVLYPTVTIEAKSQIRCLFDRMTTNPRQHNSYSSQ